MTKKSDFKHDPVRESIAKGIEYFNANKNRIVLFGSVILAVVIIAIWYTNHSQSKIIEAETSFGKALNLYIDGQTDLALVDFQMVIDNYDGTTSADYAKLYLIEDALTKKEIEKAEELINDLESSVRDEVIKKSVTAMRGHIALDKGEFKKAIKYYKSAADIDKYPSLAYSFKLGLIRAHFLEKNYSTVIDLIEVMLEDSKLKYTIKNEVEELLAEAEYLMNK